nr:Enoyl-(Acyl carrier protein) reductase [uncultured bacterium]
MHIPPKVALITGAARRIGAEIANTLHNAGLNIILHYHRSEHEAMRLCKLFNERRPDSATIKKADLTDKSEYSKLIDASVKEWGNLDVLINNASRFYKTPLDQSNEDNWNDLIDSNLKAPLFLAKAAASELKKQKGCIINITDIHGEKPLRDYLIYCISKSGLIMLTKSLAKELGPDIRVNAISPGTMIWPEGENELNDHIKQKMIDMTALKKEGHPEDIAKAALFLVKDADYITGQILAVDGGRSLSM